MATRIADRETQARAAWRLPAASAGFVLAFYVVLYPVRGFRVPIGSDTPVYVWWARYAGASGLGGMGTRARPAIVGLLATLSRVTGMPVSAVAEAIAPVLAVAVALAAAGLVRRTVGGDRRLFALVVVLTGSFLSLMVAGYLSTLSFGAAFVATLAVQAEGINGPGWSEVWTAAVLLAAAALSHVLFLAVAAVILAGVFAAVWPASRHDRSRGIKPGATPAGRVAITAGAGALLAAAAFLVVGGGPPAPETSRDEVLRRAGLGGSVDASYRRKVRHDFPWYRAAIDVVLAATPLLTAERPLFRRARAAWLRGEDRPALLFWGALTAWLVASLVSVIALLAGFGSPGQRLAAFCVPIPILAAIGLARLWPTRRAAAAAGATLFVVVAWLAWGRQQPLVTPIAVTEVRDAGALLARQPPGTPLILVVDDRTDKPGLYVTRYVNNLRDEVPGDRVPDVHVFVGTIDDFLARHPTLTGNAEHDSYSTSSLREVEPLLGLSPKPVAVVIQAFDPVGFGAARNAGGRLVAPGVVAAPGFEGTSILCPRCTPEGVGAGPLSPWTSVWLAPLLVVLLAVVGYPWVRVGAPNAESTTTLALSPAVGLAALAVASIAADMIGLRLGNTGGWLAFALSLLGWPLFARSRRTRVSSVP